MSWAVLTEICRAVRAKSKPTALAPRPIENRASASVVTPEILMKRPSVVSRTDRLHALKDTHVPRGDSVDLFNEHVVNLRLVERREQRPMREAKPVHGSTPLVRARDTLRTLRTFGSQHVVEGVNTRTSDVHQSPRHARTASVETTDQLLTGEAALVKGDG